MVLIKELLRVIFLSPFSLMVFAVVALLFLAPKGDWVLTERQKEGRAAYSRLEISITNLTVADAATEVGKVQTYAQKCKLKLSVHNLISLYQLRNFGPEDLDRTGYLRSAWEGGVRAVALVLVLSENDAKMRATACNYALSAYGKFGSILPGLLE